MLTSNASHTSAVTVLFDSGCVRISHNLQLLHDIMDYIRYLDTEQCGRILSTDRQSQKSKLYYDRRSVRQFVLLSGTHLGPATKFSPSFLLFLGSNGFVDVGRPL
jgi:hypothetical protein